MTTTMPFSKTPANVLDCEVKPRFWDDDVKMDAWFAPFRNRDLNPLNYDNKMSFWKNNINYFCAQTKQCYFNLDQLKRFFSRNEKGPSCLTTVLDDMIKEGLIQNLSDFESTTPNNNTWTGWAVKTLIGSPFKWSMKKVADVVGSPAAEINEHDEYVHIQALKEQSENLYKVREGTKDIFTYDTIQELYCKKLNTHISLKTIKLLIHWLELDGRAQVYFENKHCNVHLIKFKSEGQTTLQISEADVSIYILQKKEQMLINQLRVFETEKENTQIEVKKYLKQKMRIMAKNTLRKQKELEKRIAKFTNALENIQSLLYKVQDTETDSQILESYKFGSSALKSRICKAGLNLDNVDHTMDEIEKVLDLHNDIQETLGQVVVPQNEAELENELAELLLNDVPSVPHEPPSSGGKTAEDSRIAWNDLPDLPDTLSKSSSQIELSKVII